MLRTPVKMLAAALAAGAVLTACGPVHLGAAAVMTNERISSSDLSHEVANLNQNYLKYKGKVQLQFQVSQMPQEVLSWLIRFKVADEMAARNGFSVTPGQIAKAGDEIKKSAVSQSTGQAVPLQALAVANGLPPDMLIDLSRFQAIQDVILNRLDGGTAPTDPTAQQAVTAKLATFQCHAAKALNIRVNPQYGRLDYGSGISVIAAPSDLSASGGATPAPSPSSSVQLTPHC